MCVGLAVGAARGSLVEGGRARCFRQAGGSRQTEADGVLGVTQWVVVEAASVGM